jgi:signal transduction histidine kinase
MNWNPGYKWLVAGFGSAALWLGTSNWLSYQNSTQLIDSNRRVLQSYEIIQHLTTLYADITVAESGRRGYVFLADRAELDRYEAGATRIQTELTELRTQLQPDLEQTRRFEEMEGLIQQRLALLERSIKLYKQNEQDQDQQRQLTIQSVDLRDQIQRRLAQMQDVEEGHLKQGLQQSQSNVKIRFLIEGWWIVSVFGLLMLAVFTFHQQLHNRQTIESRNANLLQLQELNSLKLQFFSMASHEFRTPLSIILGSSQLLMTYNHEGNAEKIQKNTLRIQSSAKAMTQLLDDILMLTRAEAGKLHCDRQRLELMSFCLNLVEDIKLANADHPNIQFISRSQYPYADLDEKILYSILSNLLFNAIKYSSPNSPVQLILERDESHILFHVKDQGMGINSTDMPHLYKPFYRGGNVNDIAGSGLGLAVVHTCVALHQGTIDVTSGEQQGSLFTVRLPIVNIE